MEDISGDVHSHLSARSCKFFFLDVHFFCACFFFCVAPERPTPRTSHVRSLSPPVGVTPRTSPRTLPKQQHCRNVVFGVVFSPFSPAPGPISAFQPRFSPSSRRRLSVPPIIFTFYSIFFQNCIFARPIFCKLYIFCKSGNFCFLILAILPIASYGHTDGGTRYFWLRSFQRWLTRLFSCSGSSAMALQTCVPSRFIDPSKSARPKSNLPYAARSILSVAAISSRKHRFPSDQL